MIKEDHMFPREFIWGAATAAYQIEGATSSDGRGQSIWDTFSHTAGKCANGDTGDRACDHYHLFHQDIDLMRQLGIQAYRFSVSWSRVIPEGKGPVNQCGLDFYDRLVDRLLACDIQPYLTLYHWDLPQALQDMGGWANRDTGGYFQDYAALMVHRLGDRVRHWITLNEPWCIAFLGNRTGEHAPGLKDERLALQVSHNLMVAHGQALQAIRATNPTVEAGIVLSFSPDEPASTSESERQAAEDSWDRNNGWFLEPLICGHYPPSAWRALGDLAPQVMAGDLSLISQKMDFLGVNYYFRTVHDEHGVVSPVAGSEYTDMNWEVHAPALRRLLVRLDRDYRLPPLYITENGAAFRDVLGADGTVHDHQRQRYLHDHIAQARLAISDGVNLRGYFVWSILDNFEWAFGYSKRFGLIYVDFHSQRRIPKDSAYWYAHVIKHHGLLPLSATAG